jgi:hypothetical protein
MIPKNLPTDADILAVVAARDRCMTYAITNRINMSRRRDAAVPTSWVLRQLKRLERLGKVQRVNSVYLVQYCWSVVP